MHTLGNKVQGEFMYLPSYYRYVPTSVAHIMEYTVNIIMWRNVYKLSCLHRVVELLLIDMK